MAGMLECWGGSFEDWEMDGSGEINVAKSSKTRRRIRKISDCVMEGYRSPDKLPGVR